MALKEAKARCSMSMFGSSSSSHRGKVQRERETVCLCVCVCLCMFGSRSSSHLVLRLQSGWGVAQGVPEIDPVAGTEVTPLSV